MAEPRREANVACGDSRTNAGSKDEKAAELRPKEIDSALAWEFPAVAAPQLWWLMFCSAGEPGTTSGPIVFRCSVEMLFQTFPTINIVILQLRILRGKLGDHLREPGFEHERHRVLQIHRIVG